MHRRGRKTRDNTPPTCPQPRRRGPLRQRRRDADWQVDIRIQRAKGSAQLVLVGNGAVAQRLASDEWLIHAVTVADRPDGREPK
jgi:hypothetical protein